MRIIGIDPSIKKTGYGIIDEIDGQFSLVKFGVINSKKKNSFPEKLKELKENIESLLDYYSPDELALEEVFFSKNQKTSLALATVKGAIYVAAASKNKPIFEYSSNRIKKAITGWGKAHKSQVKEMIRRMLNINPETLIDDDSSDALAIAICHANSKKFLR
ncbi:MAG: crossover junction endodeoxyribonuclease RuvC [Acidobacteriota bacterium]